MLNKTNLINGAIVGGSALLTLALLRKTIKKFSFKNKVVLITGGSRGLGLVMARMLADEGANVVICAREVEELDIARQELQENYEPEMLALVCDVTDENCVKQMVEKVHQHFGRIDVLINNAGVIQVGPLAVQTRQDFADSLAIHFWGAFNTIEAVLPFMREQGEGRIVNIASIGGKVAVPHLAPYCSGKFALVGFSNALRTELAKDNITVTTVCPGLMRTGSHVNATFKGQNEKEYALFSIMDASPLASIGVERAARQIIESCRRGDAEKIITLQANLAAKANALFPELVADTMGFVNRFLPGAGGIGTSHAAGKESTSDLAPSFLTWLADKESFKNNELKPNEQIS